jgi:hypothetical protein
MGVDRHRLEEVATSLGKTLGRAIDAATGTEDECGFALFVFTYGPGGVAYISSANREDIVGLVREWCDRQEAGLDSDPLGPRGSS